MSRRRMFETFGFRAAYAVEVDPEFPGDGHWDAPFFAFHRDGHVTRSAGSVPGVPLVIRVTVDAGSAWVGSFSAGDLPGVAAVFACPSPRDVCVVVDGSAYLVNVERPGDGSTILSDQALQVLPVEGMDLLLRSFIDVAGVGSSGTAWRSERIAIDGLTIDDATSHGIVCTRSMSMLGGEGEIVKLDPATGTVLEGGLGAPWI
jgi:hypothetical protein